MPEENVVKETKELDPARKEFYSQNNQLIAERLQVKDSVLQLDKEGQKTLHAPKIVYAPYKTNEIGQFETKDGKAVRDFNAKMKSRALNPVNYLAAAEFMRSIGSTNPNFIPVGLAKANWNLQPKEDAKTFKLLMPYKDKEGNRKFALQECYNLAQIEASKQTKATKTNVFPEQQSANHRADLFLRDMVGYGHARMEKGTFKQDNIPMMVINMTEAAMKNHAERKPFYEKEDARLQAVKDVDLTEEPKKNDYKGRFMKLLKENYQLDSRSYTVNAVKEALNQKWQKSTIQACVTNFAPQAVYDEWRKTSYATIAITSAEKQLKEEKGKAVGAAR